MLDTQNDVCTIETHMTLDKINSGKKGEQIAVLYLQQNGYKILQKNYRTKYGEIDIIADEKGCICFVEVRSRNSHGVIPIEETITRSKKSHIQKAALCYIKEYSRETVSCRFDVIFIEELDSNTPEVRLIKNAFELSTKYRY